MSDSNLPPRLEKRLLEEGFASLSAWCGLILSMEGFGHRVQAAAKKFPDHLLVAALREQPRECAQVASAYEGEDLQLIVQKVYKSRDVFALRELAFARPDLEDEIQNHLTHQHKTGNESITGRSDLNPHFFEDFLRHTKNTNPVPVQTCIAAGNSFQSLVDITISLPHRTSLFATVMLVIRDSRDKLETARILNKLCASRPEALAVIQQCLKDGFGIPRENVISICAKLPGIDLDSMEEHIVENWAGFECRRFCAEVKRERGPARDLLAVEDIMES